MTAMTSGARASRHRLGRDLEQALYALLGERLAAEQASHGTEKDAEREQGKHERVGHRAGHGEAAVGIHGVKRASDVSDLTEDHALLRA